jgi:hypothetical protein
MQVHCSGAKKLTRRDKLWSGVVRRAEPTWLSLAVDFIACVECRTVRLGEYAVIETGSLVSCWGRPLANVTAKNMKRITFLNWWEDVERSTGAVVCGDWRRHQGVYRGIWSLGGLFCRIFTVLVDTSCYYY